MSIIDAHSHLGDILYPGGGKLIARTGVVKAPGFDVVAVAERSRFRSILGLEKILYRLAGTWVTRAERERNFAATLENFCRSMDECGITHSVCLPIPPNLTFADLETAAAKDPRLIPFTGIDYTRAGDPGPVLAAEVARGARGLKLHPIIQKVPLTSQRTRDAVEAFGAHGLPVLLHCGISSYYLGAEKAREEPGYGKISDAADLVSRFPKVRFVAGHAGLFEVDEVIELLGGFRNVWVETSFQPATKIRKLLATFGPERVLFGSDWPYGNRRPAMAAAEAACRGDRGLERRIFYENAAELLGVC